MKLLKNRIVFIIITVVLSVTAIVLSLMLTMFFRNTSNFFDMKVDDDNSSYCSNKYDYSVLGPRSGRYLSYNNGKIVAKKHNGNKITSYSPTDKKSYNAPENADMLDNKLFYIQNKNLYCKNIDTDKCELIDKDCDNFVLNDKIIAYTKDKDVYIKEINGFNLNGVINLKNEIYYFSAIDDNLYLIERVYDDLTKKYGDHVLYSGKEYIFSKYDANTLECVSSITEGFVNSIEHIAVCKDVFYFYYEEMQIIYNVPLDGSNLPLIRHNDVVDITSNNENIFFVSEKTENNIIRTTVECDTNGIWKVNVGDNTAEKISDKCVFNNILATKNYIYGYRVIYSLPRGMDNMFVIGYSLEQIAINSED